MNIYDYIKSNNNELIKMNTLDALIFTRLSYIHFENILDKLPISINELSKYLKIIHTNKNDMKLVNLLKDSTRFKDIKIKRCMNIIDIDNEEIFMAITIMLPQNDVFISFRGTTKNAYDFKEDMNMSYKIIASCFDAVKYVNDEKKYRKIYIGGHSKGGHLAMYAASHTKKKNYYKIGAIYNFDGPGFLEFDKTFLKIQKKILNFFPENSIVGRMMSNDAAIIPIKTNKQGIEAHNLYNWKVENNDLVIGKLSQSSNDFHRECLYLLKVIPKEKRENVINHFFNLMLKGELKSIKELDLIKIKEIVNTTPHLSKEEKSELIKFFKVLIKCFLPNSSKARKKIILKKEKDHNITINKNFLASVRCGMKYKKNSR